MTRIFGISNCSTVKNARLWLAEHGIDAEFIDFKKTPPAAADIARWRQQIAAETLLNRQSATWRKLDAATQAQVNSEPGFSALLCTHATLIKRPVLEHDGRIYVGFKADAYATIFARGGETA